MTTDIQRAALAYVYNAGGASADAAVPIAWFDDDHDFAGPALRGDLVAAGLLVEVEIPDMFGKTRCLRLTDAGRKAFP
jgi:hypothetical protein